MVLWNNRFKEPGFLNHDQFTLQSCSNHLNHRKKKRFTTKVKLIHGQHWQWLAASLSLKSCLDDQNGTLKKSFLEFFSPFCKNFDTMTCNFFEALFDFQKLHSSFFVTFQPKFLLHFLHLLLRQFRTWHPPPPPSPTPMFRSLQGSYCVAQW